MGRLRGAVRFGIFIGILFSIISLYLPKAVIEQCGTNNVHEYEVFGIGPFESPVPTDVCGSPSAKDKAVEEIKEQSKVISASVEEVVNVEEVKTSFPLEKLMGEYINMNYLESKPAFAQNFMSFSMGGSIFFLLFARRKSLILNRFN